MYNFNNRKNQKLITTIVLIVVVAMVVTTLISAFIIYLCGFVLFFKIWINRFLDKRDERQAAKELKGGEE